MNVEGKILNNDAQKTRPVAVLLPFPADHHLQIFIPTMAKASPPPPKKAKIQIKRDKPKAVSSVPPAKDKGKQKAVPQNEPSTLPSTFKIVAGSYEKLLYGLEGRVSGDDDKLEYHLKPIFIFPAHGLMHQGCCCVTKWRQMARYRELGRDSEGVGSTKEEGNRGSHAPRR